MCRRLTMLFLPTTHASVQILHQAIILYIDPVSFSEMSSLNRFSITFQKTLFAYTNSIKNMNFTFDGSDMQSGSRCHEECGEVRHGTG